MPMATKKNVILTRDKINKEGSNTMNKEERGASLNTNAMESKINKQRTL
jgi:hypothetical protein